MRAASVPTTSSGTIFSRCSRGSVAGRRGWQFAHERRTFPRDLRVERAGKRRSRRNVFAEVHARRDGVRFTRAGRRGSASSTFRGQPEPSYENASRNGNDRTSAPSSSRSDQAWACAVGLLGSTSANDRWWPCGPGARSARVDALRRLRPCPPPWPSRWGPRALAPRRPRAVASCRCWVVNPVGGDAEQRRGVGVGAHALLPSLAPPRRRPECRRSVWHIWRSPRHGTPELIGRGGSPAECPGVARRRIGHEAELVGERREVLAELVRPALHHREEHGVGYARRVRIAPARLGSRSRPPRLISVVVPRGFETVGRHASAAPATARVVARTARRARGRSGGPGPVDPEERRRRIVPGAWRGPADFDAVRCSSGLLRSCAPKPRRCPRARARGVDVAAGCASSAPDAAVTEPSSRPCGGWRGAGAPAARPWPEVARARRAAPTAAEPRARAPRCGRVRAAHPARRA